MNFAPARSWPSSDLTIAATISSTPGKPAARWQGIQYRTGKDGAVFREFNAWKMPMDLSFSRDGKWLAYASDETGRSEIYVQSFPIPGGKVLISTNGGDQPGWRGDGKELYYLTLDRKLMSV